MPFQIDKHSVNEGYRKSLEDINNTLKRLRARRVSVVSAATDPIKPKIVWKVEVYVQGMIYRTVALTDSVCESWNNGNALASIILARSVMETAAIVFNFWTEIKSSTNKEDTTGIDQVVTRYTLNTKWEPFKDERVHGAPSMMNLLDKMDREFFKDRREKWARKGYDFLSEFCHPNWPGAVGTFGELNPKLKEMRFSETRPVSKLTLPHIIGGVTSIRIVEFYVDKIGELIPEIWRLADANK